MIYPPLPTGYRTPIPGYGRPMFTEAQLRNYGEECVLANVMKNRNTDMVTVSAIDYQLLLDERDYFGQKLALLEQGK
jgi:hypothetical protein